MAQLLQPEEIFFTNFEPKLKHRFIMYIDGIPSFLIRKIDLPNVQSDEVEIPHMNVFHYVKGKSRWQETQMELYDPIFPSGAQAAMEWFRLSHESVTGRDGYSQMYKKDIVVNMVGPVGDKVSEYIFKGAWPKSVEMGDADWSDDNGYVNIVVNIRYDYAIVNY
jgi:hypothetical protein